MEFTVVIIKKTPSFNNVLNISLFQIFAKWNREFV